MRGIKIPQYEFALKMQGGLMREGGRICGTLRYIYSAEIKVGDTVGTISTIIIINIVGDNYITKNIVSEF